VEIRLLSLSADHSDKCENEGIRLLSLSADHSDKCGNEGIRLPFALSDKCEND